MDDLGGGFRQTLGATSGAFGNVASLGNLIALGGLVGGGAALLGGVDPLTKIAGGVTMLMSAAKLLSSGINLFGNVLSAGSGLMKMAFAPLKAIGKAGFKLMESAFRFLLDAAKQLDNIVGASASFKNLEILFLPIKLAFEILGAGMKKGTLGTVKAGLTALKEYVDFILFSGNVIGELAGIPFDLLYGGFQLLADGINIVLGAIGSIDLLYSGLTIFSDGINNVLDTVKSIVEFDWKDVIPDLSSGIPSTGTSTTQYDGVPENEPRETTTNVNITIPENAIITNLEEFINSIGDKIMGWFF